ncbi:uncharacterized protein [Montipora capricornis]|uniref:uncharacterized protein n=1 Tax=Montipora capricornis TaxID=246305 RepID=UPI0035F1C472
METTGHLALLIFAMCNFWRVNSSEPCFFIVNGSSGMIKSSFIQNTCSWLIAAPPRHNIVLNFTTLNIVKRRYYGNPRPSTVKVYDGRNISQTLLGHFTSSKSPFTLQSSGHYMLVVATGSSRFTAVYTSSARKDKPRVLIPLRVIRTVSEHYVWCSSEGTPPINITLKNSSSNLAFGNEMVWSKINQDGNYSCIATNEVGAESKTFYVSLIDFRVCVNLCHCRSHKTTFQVENIFRCTGKNSTHILNSIPTTTTWL